MPQTILFTEFAEDCPRAIAQYRQNPDTVTLLALTPEICELFESQGLPYRMPFRVNDIETLNEILADNVSRVHRWSGWMQKQLVERMPEATRVSFNPVRCCVTSILSLFTAYSARSHAIKSLVEELRPERLVFFHTNVAKSGTLIFQPGESAWGEMGLALSEKTCLPPWISDVTCQTLPSAVTPASIQRRIRQNYTRTKLARRWMGKQKARLFKYFDRWKNRSVKSNEALNVVVFGRDSELQWLSRELEGRANIDLDHWLSDNWVVKKNIPSLNEAAISNIEKRLLEDPETITLGSWDAVNWLPAMKKKLEIFFHTEWCRRWEDFHAVRHHLTRNPPFGVIHGEVGHENLRRTWLESISSMKIPTFFYQAGGGYGYYVQPYLELNELRSDFALAYTPTIAEVISRQVQKSPYGARAKGLAAGSPTFSRLKSHLDAKKRIEQTPKAVYFLPTTFAGMYWYGPNLNLEDTQSFQLQKIILSAIAVWGKLPVVLKLHPTRIHAVDPINKWIDRNKLKIEISTENLDDKLDPQNLWVIDYPSTIFQQILLAGGKTVYVKTRNLALYPEVYEALNPCALILDGWASDFDAQMAGALDRLMNGWQPESREFIRRYVNLEESYASPQAMAAHAADTTLRVLRQRSVS